MQTSKDNQVVSVASWNMIHANKVQVLPGTGAGNKPVAVINVNDGELVHEFGIESRVSKSLLVTPATALADRFVGGKFFTINDSLVDMRDGQYNGFVHDTAAVQRLVDTIGVSKLNALARGIKHNTTQGDLLLSNIWGDQNLSVDGYNDGGVFTSRIRYNWSPFSQSIRGVFELVRMICTNGMVGMTDFFNARIPMINRWDEHMDIAYNQIQNKVQGRVKQRIGAMGSERASVGELLQIVTHASNRLKRVTLIDQEERQRFRTIESIADPRIHLGTVYHQDVFDDKNVASRLAGHMSAFDAWNLVTEMYSHTKASDESSDVGLQRMANSLVFDGEQRNKRMLTIGRSTKLNSSFLDPNQAFYGVMQ